MIIGRSMKLIVWWRVLERVIDKTEPLISANIEEVVKTATSNSASNIAWYVTKQLVIL